MIRRTRAEMIEETRDKLVATGRQAFGSAGYANTSMDDLTAKAGLTRGALYHHFGGKEGLLAAVVDQIDEEVDLRLQTMSATAPSLWKDSEGAVGPISSCLWSRRSGASSCRMPVPCWVTYPPPLNGTA